MLLLKEAVEDNTVQDNIAVIQHKLNYNVLGSAYSRNIKISTAWTVVQYTTLGLSGSDANC